MAAPTARARPSLALIGMLTVGALAFAVIGWDRAPLSRAMPVMRTVPIFDDDDGAAMFAVGAMEADEPVRRCIRIGSDGAEDAGTVRLAAESVSGELAARLDVAVERGPDGTSDDCTAFTGTPIFTGTLAGLATSGDGVLTGWRPADEPEQTFRITVTLTGAQPSTALGAHADFVWRLQSEPAPGVPPPGVSAPGAPAPASPAPASPAPASPATASPVPASSAPGASAAPPVLAAPGLPPAESESGLAAFFRGLVALVQEAVKHAAIPIALIAAMAGFLLLQNGIDRRDPKLALAPVLRSRYLWIPRTTEVDE